MDKDTVKDIVGKKTLKKLHARNLKGTAESFTFAGTLPLSKYENAPARVPTPMFVSGDLSDDGSYDLRVSYFKTADTVSRFEIHDVPAVELKSTLRSLVVENLSKFDQG